MLTLENLAARLASDPDFRRAFVVDPQGFQNSLDKPEQQALDGLRGLLALAPDDLLSALLGNSESEVEGPPEWAMPISLIRASRA